MGGGTSICSTADSTAAGPRRNRLSSSSVVWDSSSLGRRLSSRPFSQRTDPASTIVHASAPHDLSTHQQGKSSLPHWWSMVTSGTQAGSSRSSLETLRRYRSLICNDSGRPNYLMYEPRKISQKNRVFRLVALKPACATHVNQPVPPMLSFVPPMLSEKLCWLGKIRGF